MTRTNAGAASSRIALLIALLALLVGAAAYANYQTQVQVSFSIQSSRPARMQIFHDANGRFGEARSLWLDVADGAPQAVAFHVRGKGAMRLRLDPPVDAVTTLCRITVGRAGLPAEFEILHSAELAATAQAGCLHLQAGGAARDPQLALRWVGASARELRHAARWQWGLIATLLLLVPVALRLAFLIRFADIARAMPMVPGFANFQQWAHWACAVLMLGFGLAYIAVTPPGAVADEEAHLASVIRISQDLGPGASDAQRMPNPRVMYGPFSNYTNNKEPFTREQLATQLGRPLVCEAGAASIPRGTSGYFAHHYLLPAVVFKIGCTTGASFGWFLYVARILNLLLATALVGWGVACAARGKLALLFIALLPMSLFQMSSLSADSLVFSLGIAWLGVVSGVASGTLLPRRAAVALWGLSWAIAFLKPGAAWLLVGLMFCKPAYDAAGESFRAPLVKFLLLPWMVHLGLTLSATGGARAFVGVDAAANVQSLASDPLGFLHLVTMTFYDRGERLWETMVGVLGWLDVPLSGWAYWAAGVMGLAAFFANGEPMLRRPKYVVPLVLLAGTGSLVVAALPLFIYWTPSGSLTILGLQGRYFTMTAAFVLVGCGVRSPPPVRALLGALLLIGLAAINRDAVDHLYDAYFVVGRR